MSQVTIIKSNRKTVSIQVDIDSNIIVRAPKQMSQKQIDAHLDKYKGWIEKKTAELEEISVQRHDYNEGEIFYLLGEQKRLTFVDDMDYAFKHEEGLFKVSSEIKEHAKDIIWQFYKNNAKHVLVKRGWEVAEAVNLKPKVFKVSSAEKRWGSCSGRGNINLSFHMMSFPMQIIDYVIVHELAHLHYMDHSKEFWGLVEKMMPDYKSRLKWLKENSFKFRI